MSRSARSDPTCPGSVVPSPPADRRAEHPCTTAPVVPPPWWYRALSALLEPWAAGWGQGGDAAARRTRRGRGLPAAGTWIHAASVGEAMGVRPLVARWRADRPGDALLLTALTPGGRRALERDHPDLPVAAPPVDSLAAARRAFGGTGAARLVLLETELWPSWLAAAIERGVRVAVANARLSDRAWGRYRRWGRLFRPYVSRLCAVAAQTALDAERWQTLGTPAQRVRVVGSTKFDRAPPTSVPLTEGERAEARRKLGLDPDATWCVFGSLRPGEERWVARALVRDTPGAARLLVVPRHPERWGAARKRPGDGGRAVWLRSLGILPDAYRAADFAVIGGTLQPYGGHNPVEAAGLGIPVLLGPSVQNCRAAAAALLAGGGARTVQNPEALAGAIAAWTTDRHARREAGLAAHAGARSLAGAARRTVEWFEECGLWEP